MKSAWYLTVLLLAITVLGCNDNNSAVPAPDAAVVNSTPMVPAMRLTAADGSLRTLNEFTGKKIFVNLWATWCPPCRAEIPSIEALKATVDTGKVEFIMLSLDENFELAKTFARENSMTASIYTPADNLPSLFQTEGIPATFIFNERGELIRQQLGAADYNTPEYRALLGGR